MRRSISAVLLVGALATASVVGAWAEERHPVLRTSMQQLGAIQTRLEKAPTDFGGHKQKAIEAIGHAINELQQAIQSDKK